MDRQTLDRHLALARSVPDYLTSCATSELHAIYRASQTLPLEQLRNTGAVRVDVAGHRVWRDSFWKGTFARDHILGWEEHLMAPKQTDGSYYSGSRFWKRFDTVEAGVARGLVVNYNIGALPGKPEVRQVAYPDDKRRYAAGGDAVLLLNYVNHPYRKVYDLIKVIGPDTCIGIMHLGEFPRGLEVATFVMSRNNHPFAHMSVPDHDALFEAETSRTPTLPELAGSWRGTLVFSRHPDRTTHNQFNPRIVSADFSANAASTPTVRIGWSRGRHDDLRLIAPDTLLGRRYRGARAGALSRRYVLTRSHVG